VSVTVSVLIILQAMKLADLVKEVLGTSALTPIGGGSGCISSGTAYRTHDGREVFVKSNNKSEV